MMEYSITKIIDGLFIGDNIVALDIPFLSSNKIIRMFGWTAQPLQHHLEDDDLQEIILAKNIEEIKFPDFHQLENAFQFLDVAQEEMLCALIYSQTQIEASLICVLYLMRRFRWTSQTAFDFLRTKIEIFQCSEQTLDELQKYGEYLKNTATSELSQILWDFDFLETYKCKSEDQALLIVTVKNKMRGNRIQYKYEQRNVQKKSKRVKWQDQLRPSSALSVNSIKRGSLLKGRLVSPTHCVTIISPAIQQQIVNRDLQLLYNSVGFKPGKIKQKSKQNQVLFEESTEYQQLKELSRTNFNDRRYVSAKMRRRGSLKPNRESQKQKMSNSASSLQNLVGIYGNNENKNGKKLARVSSAQSFLTGLRSFNKMAGSHA